MHYRGLKKGARGFRIGCMFGLDNSEGKALPLAGQLVLSQKAETAMNASVVWHKKWYSQPSKKETPLTEMPPETGVLVLSCQKDLYEVTLNGKTLLKYTAEEPNDRRGVGLVVGQSSPYYLTHLQVKGRLDPRWLKNALARE